MDGAEPPSEVERGCARRWVVGGGWGTFNRCHKAKRYWNTRDHGKTGDPRRRARASVCVCVSVSLIRTLLWMWREGEKEQTGAAVVRAGLESILDALIALKQSWQDTREGVVRDSRGGGDVS